MSRAKRAVFVGLTTVDIFNYVEIYPGANEKMRADKQLTLAGGPAANAAVAYSSFGNAACLVSRLGRHPLASLALQDLKMWNIEIIDRIRDSSAMPTLSLITIPKDTGERSVVYGSDNQQLANDFLAIESIMKECSIVLCDGHLLGESVILAKRATQLGIPVVADLGSWKDGLESLLPFVDIAICSAGFLPPGCIDNRCSIKFLQKYGVRKIAVSRGEKSIITVEGEQQQEIAVPSVHARDTLGAGDILHGSFCHFLRDHSFAESLQRAAAVASASVEYLGTREWIVQRKAFEQQ